MATSTATTTSGGLTGRHVLLAFISFFGVIFAVNGYFLYAALGTYTGVVAQEPYRKGLHYNDRIDADAAQASLGWRHTIEAARDGAIEFTVMDRNGAPVAGLGLGGAIGRPSTREHDRVLAFAEVAPGRYRASAGALEPGTWVASVEAATAAGATTVYRGRNRLWLKP
jgi:nitrogen fixation protein FixH